MLCSYASGRTAEAFQTYLENAVTQDKGFARIPSLDEFASQFSTSKDLKTLVKDAQVSLCEIEESIRRGSCCTRACQGDRKAQASSEI